MARRYAVLMVCMGNICRSPTAHAVFRHRVEQAGLGAWVQVDSAGTHNYHPGSPPDARSQRHAARRGYDLSSLRARQISDADYQRFDLILAMDWDNLALLQDECPPEHQRKLRRFMEFAGDVPPAVPDPYYGGEPAFEYVLDLVEQAADGLLAHVVKRISQNSDWPV